jgi:hypothetical protein
VYQVLDDVAEDGDLSIDDFVDVLGLDLKVDDATAAFQSCCPSRWGECCIMNGP